MITQDQINQDVKILSWKRVGNYAVQFSFSDGHSTGIYAYEYLRTLCPCEQCKANR